MNGESLVDYARAKPHAGYEYKKEWEAHVLTLAGKTFVFIGEYKDGRPIATMKCDPVRAEELREAYDGAVIPGYYSNKRHWNSVFLDADADIDENTVRALIDDAYDLVYAGLTRKAREGLG